MKLLSIKTLFYLDRFLFLIVSVSWLFLMFTLENSNVKAFGKGLLYTALVYLAFEIFFFILGFRFALWCKKWVRDHLGGADSLPKKVYVPYFGFVWQCQAEQCGLLVCGRLANIFIAFAFIIIATKGLDGKWLFINILPIVFIILRWQFSELKIKKAPN